jgi:hypothetical protein
MNNKQVAKKTVKDFGNIHHIICTQDKNFVTVLASGLVTPTIVVSGNGDPTVVVSRICDSKEGEAEGTLQSKFHLFIPFLGIALPQIQFPHSCVCGDLYTVFPGSVHIFPAAE